MNETKEFTIGAVLSATTGILLCPLGDLYAILNWMTGEDLMVHQLIRAGKRARPALLKQHPFLGGQEIEARLAELRIQLDTARGLGALNQQLKEIIDRWVGQLPPPGKLNVAKMDFAPVNPLVELCQMLKDREGA